jgi:enoyl-CoA hydratase/carnithine racemase
VSTAFAHEITSTMADVGADLTVRAVVLSSAVERAFCVGADLKSATVSATTTCARIGR